MTLTEISLWLGTAAVPIGSTAAFLKWYISRWDSRQAAIRQEKSDAQERLDEAVEARFEAQDQRINDMGQVMAEQQQTIKQLREMLDSYIRHTNRLELMLARAGIDVPPIQLTAATGRLL